MSIDYVALKADLDAGTPLTGDYNVDDQLAADELNIFNISGESEAVEVYRYITLTRNRSNVGADVILTQIYGRLHACANGKAGDDPYGSGTLLTIDMTHSASTFLDALTLAVVVPEAVDLTSIGVD